MNLPRPSASTSLRPRMRPALLPASPPGTLRLIHAPPRLRRPVASPPSTLATLPIATNSYLSRVCLHPVAASHPLTSSRSYSSSGQTIRDPNHPKGLYYHPLSATGYAVSLLPTIPPSETHPSVLGHITLPSASTEPIKYAREHPDELVINKTFWNLLHQTLKEDVVRGEKDEVLIQEADLREAGWAHLADERQPLMPGRIPTPDAIIASVSFTDCRVAPDSYEINDTYRPVTREEGFIVLKDVWLEALKARLSKMG